MRLEAVLFDLFDTLLLLESEVFYPPSLRKLHEFLIKNDVDVPQANLCMQALAIMIADYRLSKN